MNKPTQTTIQQVAAWLSEADSVVAFTGAGMSTESGVPDFRSPGGIWSTSQPVYFEDFLTSATARHEYWRQKSVSHQDFLHARPNRGHLTLARWESAGRLCRVVTQNIDGLHQAAGNQQVIELHGTAREVQCLDCHARFDADPLVSQFVQQQAVPPCPGCGSELLKHATISFGQSLDQQVLQQAIDTVCGADLLITMGSSLVVEPAASLPRLARAHGAALVILNRDPTPYDDDADVVIHATIGETLADIDRLLNV